MTFILWILHSLGFGFIGSGGYLAFASKEPETRRLAIGILVVGIILAAIAFALGAYSYGDHKGVIL